MSTQTPTLFKFSGSDADAYTRRIGGVTTSVGVFALSLFPSVTASSPPGQTTPTSPLEILDNASGPGVLLPSLLSKFPTASISAVDNSADMISIVNTMAVSSGWRDRVTGAVMDSCALSGFEDGRFDISMTNFGITLFPSPVQGLKEIYRTLKPGGTAVVTTWKSVGWLPLLRAVHRVVRPDDEDVPMKELLADWAREEAVVEVMVAGRFEREEVRVVERASVMWAPAGQDAMEEMVRMMTESLGPMTKKWEDGEKDKIPAALREVLGRERERFLVEDEEGGSVGLGEWVGWVAIARK